MKLLLSVFIVTCSVSVAQVPTLDVNSSGAGLNGSVKFFDPSSVGRRSVDKMDYSEVRGRYLWDKEWHRALLTLKGGNLVNVQRAKLNLYTNSIHYIDNTLTELEAQPGLVKKMILFSDTDSAKVLGVFESLKDHTSTAPDFFYEVLNEGKIQLLKRTLVSLLKKNYDPSIGKTEYQFSSSIEYFIRQKGVLNPLNKINKTSVYEILLPDTESENWASNHNNKLKNEEEVIEFLNFLNTRSK